MIIAHCSNSGTVKMTGQNTSYDYTSAGGIVGTCNYKASAFHCANSGTITATKGYCVAAGGCIGRLNNTCTCSFLANAGTASGSNYSKELGVGGIVGSVNKDGNSSWSYGVNSGSPSTNQDGTF